MYILYWYKRIDSSQIIYIDEVAPIEHSRGSAEAIALQNVAFTHLAEA